MNFISRVKADKSKKFILTSRTNILNQGMILSDLFDINHLKTNEHELKISTLKDIDKAKILYNHIWFGELDEKHIEEIYKEKRYYKIINHKNYNPRLISYITDSRRLSLISPRDYWSHIEKTLTSPEDVWRNVIEVQIDEMSKHIVIAITLHGKPIHDEELSSLYDRLLTNPIMQGSINTTSYDSRLRALTGALINRKMYSGDAVTYDLFDPSIADFIVNNYLKDTSYISEVLICLQTLASVENLEKMTSSGIISSAKHSRIIESLIIKLSKLHSANKLDSYKLSVLSSAQNIELRPNSIITDYTKSLIPQALEVKADTDQIDCFSFIYWALSYEIITPENENLKTSLKLWILNHVIDNVNIFVLISNILTQFDSLPITLINKFSEQYIDYLRRNITTIVQLDVELLSDIFEPCDEYEQDLFTYLEEELFSQPYVEHTVNDIRSIIDNLDIGDIMETNNLMRDEGFDENYSNAWADFEEGHHSSQSIDDLFERD